MVTILRTYYNYHNDRRYEGPDEMSVIITKPASVNSNNNKLTNGNKYDIILNYLIYSYIK